MTVEAAVPLCYIGRPMTLTTRPARVLVDHVVESDITITTWIRSLPGYALDRIAAEAPDEQIRTLAMTERDERRRKDARPTQSPAGPVLTGPAQE